MFLFWASNNPLLSVDRVSDGPIHGTGLFAFTVEGKKFANQFQVGLNLLEGGLLFKGTIFSTDENLQASNFVIHIDKNIIDSSYVERLEQEDFKSNFTKESPLEFFVGLGKPNPTEKWHVVLHPSSGKQKQFSGVVKSPKGEQVIFNYTDIGELAIATVVIVVVGISAILCAGHVVVGHIRSRNCRKIKVVYGMKFNWSDHSFEMGCHVECL